MRAGRLTTGREEDRGMPPPAPSGIRLDGRFARKHQVIAVAAAEVFVREGYAATSMDEVAAVAGVSKQTVYTHFGNKQQLFLAVINEAISGVLDEFLTVLATSFPDTGDLEGDLVRLGRILLTRVMDPGLMAVRRLIIAEAVRFPELGRAWYESGPGRLAIELSESLRQLAENGQLSIEDPVAAASNFNWLIVSKPQNLVLFGVVDSFTTAQLEEFASAAVKVFLAAYGPPPAKLQPLSPSRGSSGRSAG